MQAKYSSTADIYDGSKVGGSGVVISHTNYGVVSQERPSIYGTFGGFSVDSPFSAEYH